MVPGSVNSMCNGSQVRNNQSERKAKSRPTDRMIRGHWGALKKTD